MTKHTNIFISKIDNYESMLKSFMKRVYSMIYTNNINIINEQDNIDSDIVIVNITPDIIPKQISESIIIPDYDLIIKNNNIINNMTNWNTLFDTVIEHHKFLINKGTYNDIHNLLTIQTSNSIIKFMQNIKQYIIIDSSVYVYAIILMHRFIKNNKIALTNMNKYCIFILSILIASKLLEDIPYDNKSFALCSYIPINDLNIFEMYFLIKIDFNTHINIDEYQIYQNCILDVYYNKACLVIDDKNICLYNDI